MSCLSDFKVVSILGDKEQDLINESLSEKNYSFIKKLSKKITKPIKRKFSKIFLGNLL
jgi:hypothetical protein